MKHIWLTRDQLVEVTGWPERTIRHKAQHNELLTRVSKTASANGKREREYCASSLPADAQLKVAHLRMATNLSGAKLGAPSGQLSATDANQRGELTAPSSQGFLFSPPPVIPEDQRLLLSAADLATAEERLNAIAPMLDFKNGTAAAITVGGKTISNLDDLAAYLAAQRSLSARTLWDWYSRFRKHGFAALADRLRSDKGKSRFFQKFPAAAEFAQNKFLNEQLSVELTHDALCREWPNLYNHGSQPPSYTTLRVYLNSIPRAAVMMARQGEKAFNNNLRPFGLRDYTRLAANQLWVSDHMRHDVFVRNDLNLPGLAPDVPLRLWLTAFMDARSRKITGMAWCVNPSSDSISSALRVGVSRFGIPREVLIDNGEDYKKISKQVPLSPELSGVMARLGMKVRRALPYEPQAKPIESFFRTLHKRFDAKLAPFYCGPSPEQRPEECALVLKDHDAFLKGKQATSPLMPASEFILHAAVWLTQDYNQHFEHSGHGMNSRTPNEVFDELLPVEKRQLPNREDLAPLFWERAKRTLREGGCVEIYNARYEPADPQSGARLQLHRNDATEVIVACDPMNLGEAIAFDLDGRFLGFLHTQERLNWNLSKEDLRAHMRKRAKLGRVTRDYLGGLARRRELAGDGTELDSMRQRVGIVEAAPEFEQPQLPSEAIAPMRAARRAIAAAAAAAPDYSADVAERLRALREEGGD